MLLFQILTIAALSATNWHQIQALPSSIDYGAVYNFLEYTHYCDVTNFVFPAPSAAESRMISGTPVTTRNGYEYMARLTSCYLPVKTKLWCAPYTGALISANYILTSAQAV
jgi:hypothetical protein